MKQLIYFLISIILSYSMNAQLPTPTTGTIKRVEKFASKYVDARNVDIWLPDGYNTQQQYAVLYMHDGQMLFDAAHTWNKQEWGIDEILGNLIKILLREAFYEIWMAFSFLHSYARININYVLGRYYSQ